MVRWRLNSLLAELKDVAPDDAAYRAISAATGISTSTITAIARNEAKRVDFDTIDRLLTFFSDKLGRHLITQDLIEFLPATATAPAPKASDAARQTQRSALAPPGAQATPQQLAAEAERRQLLLAQAKGRG